MDAKSRVGMNPSPRSSPLRLPRSSTASSASTITPGCAPSNWQAVMRDPGALAPDIRAHLEAENAYTLGLMADTEELQQQLFAEMKGRIKEDDALCRRLTARSPITRASSPAVSIRCSAGARERRR